LAEKWWVFAFSTNAKEILKPLKERKQKIPHGSEKKVGFEIEFVFNVSEQIIEMSGLTDRS